MRSIVVSLIGTQHTITPYGYAEIMFEVIWHGVRDALLMAWEVWWALVFGFAISAIVQAWVPRQRIERALGEHPGHPVRPVTWATALGAASSSCSYAAIAIARSLFDKGASLTAALAFQFASTNLVWELGLVLWVLIGWQFAVAEYIGGIVMIVLMAFAAAGVREPVGGARGACPRPCRRPGSPASLGRRRSGSGRRLRVAAADVGAGVVGRRPQLPWRLADAVARDLDRLPAGGVHRAGA